MAILSHIKSIKTWLASLMIAFAFAFCLIGNPVHATVTCNYYTGGCGFPIAYDLENPMTFVPNAGACTSFCGGRTHCDPLNPMRPWGCSY